MNQLRAFSAFLLTLALFALAPKFGSSTKSDNYYDAKGPGLSIDHMAPNLYRGTGNPKIELWMVAGYDSSEFVPILYYKQPLLVQFDTTMLRAEAGRVDQYSAVLPRLPQGDSYYYYFQVLSTDGDTLVRLPADQSEHITLMFEGEPDLLVWSLHIALMFLGAMYAFSALFNAFASGSSDRHLKKLSRKVLVSGLLMAVGSLFAGSLVSLSRFGYLWGGWPFGGNESQTLMEVLILYWLGLTVLFRGTIFRFRPEKNLVSPRVALILTLLGVLFMIGVYLAGDHFVEIPL